MPRAFKKAGTFQRRAWSKMIDGKRYHIHCGDLGLPEEDWTEARSYQAAIAHWEKLLADKDAKIKTAINGFVKAAIDSANHLDGPISQAEMKVEIATCQAAVDAIEDIEERVGKTHPQMETIKEAVWEGFRNVGKPTVKKEKSLAHQIASFLDLAQQKASPATIKELRYFLGEYAGIVNEDVGTINEATVQNYYLWLCKRDLEPTSRKKRWIVFRRVIRWLWESNQCNLPRNLASREFRFHVTAKAIKTYPMMDIKKVLASLKGRKKLYALLALNCGMTQADIGNLRKDQIHGDKLTRKRVKTAQHANVPMVTYRLWNETRKLLEAYKSEDKVLHLTSKTGTPLYYAKFKGSKPMKVDLIGLQWKRAKVKLHFKAFRTFAATMIETHKEYGRYKSHFLGQSPKGLPDRHYAAPSQDLFDDIVSWLGKELGLA